MLILKLLIFVFGTIIGSFLNVVIHRLNTEESIIKKRSYCPHCKKKLNWQELIPLLSFLMQRGRCRNCKKKISWQYPLVELATGIIFLLFFDNIFFLLISCFLIIIFVYDLKHYLVADIIVYPAIVVAFLYQLQFSIFNFQFSINFQLPIFNYLIAAMIAGGFFLAIVLISRERWMGRGDIKIGVLMGLILGWPNVLIALFLAFLIGAMVSLVLMLLGKKNLKSEIPFGPFLVFATIITMLWGGYLLNWYFNIFI